MSELTSEELEERVVAEMRRLSESGAGMRLELHPAAAFAIVAFCQLALRHPQAAAYESAANVRRFIEYVRAKFEPHAPHIAEAIRRGDLPHYDTPSQERDRIIHKRIMDLQLRGERVDRVTLANELMKNGELQAVGGLSYLVTLPEPPREPEPPRYRHMDGGMKPGDRVVFENPESLIEFLASRKTPATPEEILEHLQKQSADKSRVILTCPFCGYSQIAPEALAKIDLYICAGCGRTVEKKQQ